MTGLAVIAQPSRSKLRIRVSHRGHQVQELFCEPNEDVWAGPSGRIRINHPLITETFRMFETADGEPFLLHIHKEMHGWIRHGSAGKPADLSASARWGLPPGATHMWRIRRKFHGRLTIGDYEISFAYDASSTKYDGTSYPMLRVALLMGHRVTQEIVLREPRGLMLGRKGDLKSPPSHVPNQFTLVERLGDRYYLRFIRQWPGQLTVGSNKPIPFLMYQGSEYIACDTWRIKLEEDMRLRLQVGTHVYLLNFLDPPSTIAVRRA